MALGVGYTIVHLTRYEWHLPRHAESKEVFVAIAHATNQAKELGIDTTLDNWFYMEGDDEKLTLYFEVDGEGRPTYRSGR